jgi:hypothetical protein
MAQEQTQQTAQTTTTEAADAGSDTASDASLLAELARLSDDGQVAPGDEPAVEETTEPAAAEKPEGDADDDDDKGKDDKPEGEDAKPDPELERRLEQLQRQEKRAKDAVTAARAELEQERTAFERERTEWKPKVERFEALAGRAKYDPASVLLELGLEDADFEQAARQLYALSVEGKKNPALRQQSAQSLRERETLTRLEQLEKKNAELLEQMTSKEKAAEIERNVNEYMGTVEKAVDAGSVLVQRMLEKTPAKARAQLRQVADALYSATGEVPEPLDVVARLEKIRRAELEELGLEIPAAGKTAPKTTTPAAATEKAMANKTLSNDLGTQTQPRSEQLSDEEIDAQILRDLQAGNLDL